MLTKGQSENLNETNFMGNVSSMLKRRADTQITSGDFFNTNYSYQRMKKDYYLKSTLPEIKDRKRQLKQIKEKFGPMNHKAIKDRAILSDSNYVLMKEKSQERAKQMFDDRAKSIKPFTKSRAYQSYEKDFNEREFDPVWQQSNSARQRLDQKRKFSEVLKNIHTKNYKVQSLSGNKNNLSVHQLGSHHGPEKSDDYYNFSKMMQSKARAKERSDVEYTRKKCEIGSVY